MMSFQLQLPSLFPFTLGPPSFHPWLRLCFEPDRNVGPSEWGGDFVPMGIQQFIQQPWS
jgi:hypothetical protein